MDSNASDIRVAFSVPWVAGKRRARKGRYGSVYADSKERMHEEAIGLAFQEACDKKAPAGHPVSVRVMAYYPLPTNRPKRVVSEPYTCKPDADNIAKLVLDGLNGIAWVDDAQVTNLEVIKFDRFRGTRESMDIEVCWKENAHGDI